MHLCMHKYSKPVSLGRSCHCMEGILDDAGGVHMGYGKVAVGVCKNTGGLYY